MSFDTLEGWILTQDSDIRHLMSLDSLEVWILTQDSDIRHLMSFDTLEGWILTQDSDIRHLMSLDSLEVWILTQDSDIRHLMSFDTLEVWILTQDSDIRHLMSFDTLEVWILTQDLTFPPYRHICPHRVNQYFISIIFVRIYITKNFEKYIFVLHIDRNLLLETEKVLEYNMYSRRYVHALSASLHVSVSRGDLRLLNFSVAIRVSSSIPPASIHSSDPLNQYCNEGQENREGSWRPTGHRKNCCCWWPRIPVREHLPLDVEN
ncbi:hypothetical protein CRE_04607 [Caenorhabditis remanei]|uniref:Uncharacterized protein n=1 Tax=Caenorhabditis remanei TaxID=31234 RepID=E3LZE2_CAERE|nr:hypothetical protein CRE_04607 [Caenorhabditis remanei]